MKTKVISSTQLENVVIYVSYDSTRKVSVRITAVGRTLIDGIPGETISVELDYADLGTVKNQCEDFVKHLSRLLNKDGADEDSETIDKIG